MNGNVKEEAAMPTRASLIAQLVEHLPAVQETRVQFLGREDPLEKELADHSSVLAWRIPWTEEPGRLQSMGSQGSDKTERLNHHYVNKEKESKKGDLSVGQGREEPRPYMF